MADRLTRCVACDGRGYFRCGCWPGDCICGLDDQDCEDCGGEGIIDNFYEHSSGCDCSTCNNTGMEARHQICRDCDDAPASKSSGATPTDGGENGA